jgi:ribosomal protein L37E
MDNNNDETEQAKRTMGKALDEAENNPWATDSIRQCPRCMKNAYNRHDKECLYCGFNANYPDESHEFTRGKQKLPYYMNKEQYARRGFSGIISDKRKFVVGEGGPEKIVRKKLRRVGLL